MRTTEIINSNVNTNTWSHIVLALDTKIGATDIYVNNSLVYSGYKSYSQTIIRQERPLASIGKSIINPNPENLTMTFNQIGNLSHIPAFSDDGKYIVYFSNGPYYSSDYGKTFVSSLTTREILNSIYNGLGNGGATSVACSGDGKYMYIMNSRILRSDNYGLTFTVNTDTNLIIHHAQVACSADGKYVYIKSTTYAFIYISNDYGLTFTTVNKYNNGTLMPQIDYPKIICSSSGQNIWIHAMLYVSTTVITYSSDYGLSWSQNLKIVSTIILKSFKRISGSKNHIMSVIIIRVISILYSLDESSD
jgi:hypothetical protein